MLKWLDKIKPAVFCAFCILIAFQTSTARSETGVTFEIADISVTFSDNSLLYTITGTTPPAFTASERFSPFRVVVDVAGAYWGENVAQEKAQIPENDFASVMLQDLKENEPHVMRFEFSLADSHDYSVEQMDNSLQIKLFPTASKDTAAVSNSVEGGIALTDFKISSTPNSTTVTLVSTGPITNYTVDTIGSGVNRPPRMFIDVEDVNISELVREKAIGTSVDQIRVAPKGTGARIVFDSASSEMFKYAVAPSPEGLNVVIDESQVLAASPAKSTPAGGAGAKDGSTLDDLISSSEQLVSQKPIEIKADSPQSMADALANDFSLSGYKKQRISVDFYKIDIHNVFRLFRQITDLNIIVDEAVKGSLTLALDDVPWDFALDIIINLMDLKKEERFNTIVIYPNKKEFAWPTRAEDNLAFEADIEVIEQEALIIEKSATQSKEIMQAKEYMVKAHMFEEREEFEDAALLYEKASELWPDNTKISNRLATLYLVNLGMNAKAVYYAKQSLKNDSQNTSAALYAAIGSANMQRMSEAKEYFTQSISSSPPMKEALLSYAAFSENNGLHGASLKLLDKYHSYYGESVDTMIAKARIYDKLGRENDASKQYLALIASGFQLRPDLKRYIEERLAAKSVN